jgi:uncharacterized protein YkwD
MCTNLELKIARVLMSLVSPRYRSRFAFLWLPLAFIVPFWCLGGLLNAALADTAPGQIVTLAPPMNALQAVQRFALELVNRDRAAEGLMPMEIDPLLSQAAQSHADDMLRRNYFSHYSPEGQSPSNRLALAGRHGFPAENIVMGENHRSRGINIQLLENFQDRWMHSSDHRRNLLNRNYEKFGYGLAIDSASGRAFAVQMFRRR